VPTLRRAIAVTQSDTPGPAFVELPLDVLQPYQQVMKEASFIKNADSAEKVSTEKFRKNQMNSLNFLATIQ
jgi:thiamine pyrophosphate-dependent acetolactate synthase large subunit-like protein